MIESTKGISLHYYKYSETSIIAKIFTKTFGVQSYLIKGVRNKKSKTPLNLFSPLTILNLEVTNNKKQNLQYVKEIRNEIPLNKIYQNMNKKFVCMFISEILMKVLVENKKEETIYTFIEKSILNLNSDIEINKNYTLIFLLKMSEFLGFFPDTSCSEKKYFDLENASFTNSSINNNIHGENKEYLVSLLKNFEITIPVQNRKKLFNDIQKYYSLHHYNIEQLKSYEVIESLRK